MNYVVMIKKVIDKLTGSVGATRTAALILTTMKLLMFSFYFTVTDFAKFLG